MTATPIPRTVAMTVFGDLEVSTLSEKPAGRAEVVTHVVPATNSAWIERAWARVREEVAQGRRAYVVCARIDGDVVEEGDEPEPIEAEAPRVPLHAVVEVVEEVRARPDFAGVGITVMHGRLRPEQKDAAMEDFVTGAAPVMVCTTVIEVGVDVPQASVMLVLDADHFGISTLHQLRGRIGRSDVPGICLLVSRADPASLAGERLSALAETTDGFALAERDLELRREGDVLGAAQSGGRNSLRLLRVLKDRDVIERARRDAEAIVVADPGLVDHPALAAAISDWLDPESAEFLERS
jgi:ATP-dependent DNA helicase RecG